MLLITLYNAKNKVVYRFTFNSNNKGDFVKFFNTEDGQQRILKDYANDDPFSDIFEPELKFAYYTIEKCYELGE